MPDSTGRQRRRRLNPPLRRFIAIITIATSFSLPKYGVFALSNPIARASAIPNGAKSAGSTGVGSPVRPLSVAATLDRRTALSSFGLATGALISASSMSPAVASIKDPDPRAVTTVVLDSPDVKAGVELYDVKIGTPPRTVAAVRSVRPGGAAYREGVQPGTILLGRYPDGMKSVLGRMKSGPYPIVLQFYDLAADGDAIGDLGRPIVTAEDALEAARASSSELPVLDTQGQLGTGLGVSTIRKGGSCEIKSRRGDVLEMNYEARVGGRDGQVYDSSAERGTGQPYMFVLGSGDVIKGVDLGMYDMCPGEVRELSVPSELAYGRLGSKLYRIPSGFRVWWKVELVRVNR